MRTDVANYQIFSKSRIGADGISDYNNRKYSKMMNICFLRGDVPKTNQVKEAIPGAEGYAQFNKRK